MTLLREVEHTHWIEEMRRARGWTQRQLAKAADCSQGLIDLLENMYNGVTHPEIADSICRALGADDAHYMSIIPEARRSEPRPTPREQPAPPIQAEAQEERAEKRPEGGARRAVVVISPEGKEIGRFESVISASVAYMVDPYFVRRHCRCMTSRDEFKLLSVSFRYADEWDEKKKGELQK